MSRYVTLVALGLLLAGAAQGSGQVLERVDSLARDGRMEEARTVLVGWFTDEGGAADRQSSQRALWLRAILTLDPAQAEVDFTRLALEYPGGLFSDQALVRLARAARARGELAVSARHYRRLARDYPGSPARLEARRWLDDNAADIAADEARIAQQRAEAEAAPTDPGRPADAVADSGPDTAPAAEASGDTAAVEEIENQRNLDNPPSEGGPYTVQIGAFAAPEGARELVLRLADAGFTARLVTVGESELIRVRAGRFDDAGDATRLYDRVVAAGFDAMVVADAQREVPYL